MKKQMFIRLDDASEKMNVKNWNRMETLLDKYNIKPIVGIIPNNKDDDFQNYTIDKGFYKKAKAWEKKGWIIALHGYDHVFCTKDGGINPVNKKSEFAGLEYNKQKNKIKSGYEILKKNGLHPKVFFAPAHTFDKNTLEAIKNETDIRIISDTIAFDIYYKEPFYFIPQQSGKCRYLPFKTITYCYHPNMMNENDFDYLESFLKKNNSKFTIFTIKQSNRRKYNIIDKILNKIYFLKRKG